MATPEQFKRNMGRLAARVAENADKTVRKVAMAADQAVVMATPVDTGRARANWVANLNTASAKISDQTDRSGRDAIAQAAGVVSTYNGDTDTAIHITNNLPYIEPLNSGTSAQAPAGFVGIAIAKGISAIRGARLLNPWEE